MPKTVFVNSDDKQTLKQIVDQMRDEHNVGDVVIKAIVDAGGSTYTRIPAASDISEYEDTFEKFKHERGGVIVQE